ncbi:MAG: hypothetical protein HRF43_14965 [Phycisphaerae bacterium]|jgi:hypothetical protein
MTGPLISWTAVDAGEDLTLAATLPGAIEPERLEAAWPLRTRLDDLLVVAHPVSPADVLSAQIGPDGPPNIHVRGLVILGAAPLERAFAWAEQAGIEVLIEPACACVLWSEGVTAGRVIGEYARPVDTGGPVDLADLRAALADMMEQASEDVQRARLDQDDSLLDRYVEARYRGRRERVIMPVESLTDVERLLRPFHHRHQALHGWSAPPADVEIVAVRARCLASPLYPSARQRPSPGGQGSPPAGWTAKTLPNGHSLYRRR